MRIVFMGSPEFAATSLRACASKHDVVLVVTQPDKRKGRGKKIVPPAVKVTAEELGLEVFQPRSARTGELAEAMKASGAELAVVVAYGKILPLEVLEACAKGCVNVHASILPAYRGAAPIQWAVIDGCETTGVSIMQLDEGMDTGAVFATREVDIGAEETSGELFERLAPIGADLLLEVLDQIAVGSAKAVPQDDSKATHARMLTKADGVVDWTLSANNVANRIRGVDPWPGAQTAFGELAVKLFGVFAADGQGAPGEVLRIADDGIVVACGEGAVGVRELQPAGSRRMPAIECARGRKIEPGGRFS